MARSAIVALAATLLAVGPAASAPATPKPHQERLIRMWIDGPVRYLMTSAEYEKVQGIQNIPELARYITDFWARRDPSPGTFENEYRRLFWSRVIDANRRFQDSTVPGWKTDRGKILILLGEPDEIEGEEQPKVIVGWRRPPRGPAAPNAGERGIERWHYKRQLSLLAAPEFIVAFVRDESLEWRLSTNPDLIEPTFSGISARGKTETVVGPIGRPLPGAVRSSGSPTGPGEAANQIPGSVDTSTFANYDLGLEMSVPQNAELVIVTVAAHDFLPAFTATPRYEFFRAQDGSTFVQIGALVRIEDLFGTASAAGRPDLRIYASLTDATDPSHVRYASNESRPSRFDFVRGVPPGEMLDAWTDLELPPGHYRVVLAIEDSLTGRLGRASGEVEVPDYRGRGLAISSLVLASEIDESQGRLGATARATGVFRRSERFGVYYEVYGTSPAHGGSSFDASYRFYRYVEPGALATIGAPIVFEGRKGPAQAWSFPLGEWPVGRYRLEVVVTGADGPAASAQTDFAVVE